MQWVQVTGLPEGYVPDRDTITGLRLQADTPVAGAVHHLQRRGSTASTRMARYSFAGNIMSVFTDCPGREKLSYPADYTMPMGAIHRNFELAAYLRTTMRHLVEGQSSRATPRWPATWPSRPRCTTGATPAGSATRSTGATRSSWCRALPVRAVRRHPDDGPLLRPDDGFVDYIQREKVGTGEDAHIVDAALADWVAADQTSGRITGTWGYYIMISKMADDGGADRSRTPTPQSTAALAAEIKEAFNAHFYNATLRPLHRRRATPAPPARPRRRRRWRSTPDWSRTASATASSTPSSNSSTPSTPNGDGPHFSGGTIGMAPTVRALAATAAATTCCGTSSRRTTQPSYGFFMAAHHRQPRRHDHHRRTVEPGQTPRTT